MTHEQARNNFEAITHWKEGGDLWYRDEYINRWVQWLNTADIKFDANKHNLNYIIEDKFFEQRKAYALGETIEILLGGKWQEHVTPIIWNKDKKYRVKPKHNFKVGQWITSLNREVNKSVWLITQIDENGQIHYDNMGVVDYNTVKPWTPTVGEWVICSDDATSYTIERFDIQATRFYAKVEPLKAIDLLKGK